MKKVINTVNQIDAPASAIWEHLRTGEGVNTWLPIIETCRVDGDKRFCTTAEGSLEEDILESNDEELVFRYGFDKQNLFPVTEIRGRMQLISVAENTTLLLWDLEFNLEDQSLFSQIKEGIEGIYASGAQGLQALATSSQTV